MSYVPTIDVSFYQGNIDWNAVKASGIEIAIIKMGGSDVGLYSDSKANQNYYGAKAAGLAIGMYYFFGGGDPENEADHFLSLCSPLEQGDVMCIDYEIQHPDPVGYCLRIANRIHDRAGMWPLFYANGSTINSHDWSPVRNNCGTWVAWYGQDPEGNLPISGPYVAHQYTSSGSVPGIAGRVDMDAWFGSLDQFKLYGYQPSGPAPEPTPEPQPIPPPQPVPDPPQPEPTPEPTPDPAPAPPAPIPDPPKNGRNILIAVLTAIAAIVAFLVSRLN